MADEAGIVLAQCLSNPSACPVRLSIRAKTKKTTYQKLMQLTW